jgi:hypothetical protein
LFTVKNGFKFNKQSYLCKTCGKQFVSRKEIDIKAVWHDYVFGKQTLAQLSLRYHLSHDTIRRKLDSIRIPRIISSRKDVVVLIDTTYWGHNFGVVVFKDWRTKRILWRKFVRYETLADYKDGVEWLEDHKFKIEGIVCDGLRGMFQQLSRYRVQMRCTELVEVCQYHQLRIIQRYLTRSPELPASIELLSIANTLSHTDKESFIGSFETWCERWDTFLKERTRDKQTGKSRYVHKKLRSAYLSLKRNMPYLWTWYDYIEIGIPNTNNALEGMFTDLKTKMRNHAGLSKERRKMFIDGYFRASFKHLERG